MEKTLKKYKRLEKALDKSFQMYKDADAMRHYNRADMCDNLVVRISKRMSFIRENDPQLFKTDAIADRELPFEGMGVDMKTSLMEWGFLITDKEYNCDDNEYYILYRCVDGLYGTAHRTTEHLDDVYNHMEEEDQKAFIEKADYADAGEFYCDEFINKLNHLMQFMDYESILGSLTEYDDLEDIKERFPQIF